MNARQFALVLLSLALVSAGCRQIGLPWTAPTPTASITPIRTLTPTQTAYPADLVAVAMAISLRQADCQAENDALGLAVWLRNDGPGPAGSFTVRVNDQELLLEQLAVGELARLFVPTYQPAPQENTVVVDATDRVREADETNNSLTAQLPLPTPPPPCASTTTDDLPDLLLLSSAITLENARCLEPGDDLGVRVIVANRGGAPAGAFVVRVDGVEQSVTGLEPGGRHELFFSDGSDAPEILVDATERVLESDEGNNAGTGRLPVPTPPLPCSPDL